MARDWISQPQEVPPDLWFFRGRFLEFFLNSLSRIETHDNSLGYGQVPRPQTPQPEEPGGSVVLPTLSLLTPERRHMPSNETSIRTLCYRAKTESEYKECAERQQN